MASTNFGGDPIFFFAIWHNFAFSIISSSTTTIRRRPPIAMVLHSTLAVIYGKPRVSAILPLIDIILSKATRCFQGNGGRKPSGGFVRGWWCLCFLGGGRVARDLLHRSLRRVSVAGLSGGSLGLSYALDSSRIYPTATCRETFPFPC